MHVIVGNNCLLGLSLGQGNQQGVGDEDDTRGRKFVKLALGQSILLLQNSTNQPEESACRSMTSCIRQAQEPCLVIARTCSTSDSATFYAMTLLLFQTEIA